MIIDKDLHGYVVFSTETIGSALEHIVSNQGRIVFVVDDTGVLQGLITNGDFLRWTVHQRSVDLEKPVTSLMNRSFISAATDDPRSVVEEKLRKVLYVPVTDARRRLVGVARNRSPHEGLKIGDRLIDEISPTFLIAEIGINHNGSLELAKQLIDQAAWAGADCAKFQMRALDKLYSNAGNANDIQENLGSQYTLDLLTRFQLTTDEMFEAFDYCKAKGLIPLCTPWDETSLGALEDYDMPAYKVASADLTNHDLLRALAETRKPLICSTGMSTESEIVQSVNLLQDYGVQYVLLQCNSTYPAPYKDVNLRYMDRLGEIGNCLVGYSGHERGTSVAIAAVARGAKVIEKHLTLDRSLEGNDHKVSLLPDEFRSMIESIRQVELALGAREPRQPSQGELMNRVTLAKSLVINCDLRKGAIIEASMIETKSPGRGIQPNRRPELIGRAARRDFRAGDFFYESDLGEDDPGVISRNYYFRRPWGLPVRYHDFRAFIEKSNPDFLEFHLSYKDMDQDVHQFVDSIYDLGLIVHSPDTFAGDHLLSPSHPDPIHRARSLRELQRVIDLTRELSHYFQKVARPMIVASLGGFTRDRFLDPSERSVRYERLAEGLAMLDTQDVEIIPQTLPPYPWYFGGQLYLNLFVDPADTAVFCRTYGYRLCLDVSHAMLACNHFKWSFREYLEKLAPYTAHMHLADAQGVDGEGLQIGEGDIDWFAFAKEATHLLPQVSFIPEIWQGHEDQGAGFWSALHRLSRYGF